MDKLYFNRVDRFFHYNDQNNCNRVYKKIWNFRCFLLDKKKCDGERNE